MVSVADDLDRREDLEGLQGGHHAAVTMATCHHVLPGMQREDAETFASLLKFLPASPR